MTRSNIDNTPDIPTPCVLTCDRHDKLCVGHLNIQKLCAKQVDIIHDAVLHNCDIVCFNKTHLCESDVLSPDMFGFDNSYTHFCGDCGHHGGGVLVLVNSNLQPQIQMVSSPLEIVVLHVMKSNHVMYIISVYRPPHCNISMWTCEMTKILKLYQQDAVCMVGDFNEDIKLNTVCNIKSLFSSHDFVQHIEASTRDSGTLIDHVYTSKIQKENVNCDVSDCYYSDHDIVTCIIKV